MNDSYHQFILGRNGRQWGALLHHASHGVPNTLKLKLNVENLAGVWEVDDLTNSLHNINVIILVGGFRLALNFHGHIRDEEVTSDI